MGSVNNPLSSRVVGILFKFHVPSLSHPFARKWPTPPTAEKDPALEAWKRKTETLPKLPQEPQELDLLRSAKASYCFNFYFWNPSVNYVMDVKPVKKVYNSSSWCNYTIKIPFDASNSFYPRVLPQGMFFLCGDRAWTGVPSHLRGGPCIAVMLTALIPNITLLQDWKQNYKLTCQK